MKVHWILKEYWEEETEYTMKKDKNQETTK